MSSFNLCISDLVFLLLHDDQDFYSSQYFFFPWVIHLFSSYIELLYFSTVRSKVKCGKLGITDYDMEKRKKIIIKDRMVVISPSGWGQARLLSSEGIGFFFRGKLF